MNRDERDYHFAELEREETLLRMRVDLLSQEAALLTRVLELRQQLKTLETPNRRKPANMTKGMEPNELPSKRPRQAA